MQIHCNNLDYKETKSVLLFIAWAIWYQGFNQFKWALYESGASDLGRG